MDHSLPGSSFHGIFQARVLEEYANGLPCPPPGYLPNPGIEPRSPTSHPHPMPILLLPHGQEPVVRLPEPRFLTWKAEDSNPYLPGLREAHGCSHAGNSEPTTPCHPGVRALLTLPAAKEEQQRDHSPDCSLLPPTHAQEPPHLPFTSNAFHGMKMQ